SPSQLAARGKELSRPATPCGEIHSVHTCAPLGFMVPSNAYLASLGGKLASDLVEIAWVGCQGCKDRFEFHPARRNDFRIPRRPYKGRGKRLCNHAVGEARRVECYCRIVGESGFDLLLYEHEAGVEVGGSVLYQVHDRGNDHCQVI